MSRPNSVVRLPRTTLTRRLRACGRNLRNSTAEMNGIVRVSGIIHALKRAKALLIGAKTTSMMILAVPKAPFSAGTHTARRSPTRTLSCMVKIAVAATERTKTADWTVSRRNGEARTESILMPIMDMAAMKAEAHAV